MFGTGEIIYSDQTRQFPEKLHCNNKYIMIMVERDSNFILVEPMTSQKDNKIQHAYRNLMGRSKDAGVIPKNMHPTTKSQQV